MIFSRKDFIGLKDTSGEEIRHILETAETMKYVLNKKNKKVPHLQGKSVIFLFYEQSTRAKLSYELAAQYLSASILDMNNLQNERGGNLTDIGRLIDQMGGDFIVIRHPMAGTAKLLSEHVQASVLNAGDGFNENPTQSLLNLMTIKKQKGGFKGLKVTIVGDVAHSRVSRSDIWGLIELGAEVSIVGPPTLIPRELSDYGVKIFYNIQEAVADADVIMALRMHWERRHANLVPSLYEYKNLFKIDKNVLSLAKPDAIVMHPGPINRGVEISSEIVDSKQCFVDDQISNGVAVRMALLYLLSLKGGEPIETLN